MRFSKLSNKEIINLSDGIKIGRLENSDLLIDPETGNISMIIIFKKNFSLFNNSKEITIPWDAIIKIGPEMVIVNFNNKKIENNHQ